MELQFKSKVAAIKGDYVNEIMAFCGESLCGYSDTPRRVETFSQRYKKSTFEATSLDAEKTVTLLDDLATKVNSLFFQDKPDLAGLYTTLVGMIRLCGRGSNAEDFVKECFDEYLENSVAA